MAAPIHTFLAEPASPAVVRSLGRLAGAADVVHVAAMPDVHLAKEVCVGVAVATRDVVYPAAVGGDIGCGMTALAFDEGSGLLASETHAARLLHALYEAVPCLKHHNPPSLPAALASPLSHPHLSSAKRRDGRYQLGTLGRGNHFVEFQADLEDRLWVMVHSGSRGMGGRIRDHHLRAARVDPASGLGFLPVGEEDGRAYMADMAWALSYAAANRRRIVSAVVGILRDLFGVASLPETRLTCHHNHVREETHGGRRLLVHRKGAIDASEGVPGIVPGSMGRPSFHTLGRGAAPALRSSSHGAGRRLSRTEARKQVRLRAFERDMKGIWFDRRRAPKLRDEAPEAYRDIEAVMRAQKTLTRVVRRLRPLLAFKY